MQVQICASQSKPDNNMNTANEKCDRDEECDSRKFMKRYTSDIHEFG